MPRNLTLNPCLPTGRHKWLRSPIQINGKLVKRRKGVPQGSPLSPLLSNIMLHELDRELEKQGLRFIRYADDFSIYTKTKTIARKIGNTIFKFLKKKLKLTINREKSGIRRPVNFTCLGFGFVPTYVKGELERSGNREPPLKQTIIGEQKGKYQLVVSEKSCPKGIPMGEKAKAKAQNHHPKNHSNEF